MKKKKQIIHYILSIIFVSLFLIFSTHFVFEAKNQSIVGAFSYLEKINALSFREKTKKFSLTYNYPVSNEVGETVPAYEFQVINSSNQNIKYQLNFTTGEKKDKVEAQAIRYKIKKDDEEYSEIKTLDEEGIIEVATALKNSSTNYSLKFWIQDQIDSSIITGKTFQGIIELIPINEK